MAMEVSLSPLGSTLKVEGETLSPPEVGEEPRPEGAGAIVTAHTTSPCGKLARCCRRRGRLGFDVASGADASAQGRVPPLPGSTTYE